MSLEGKDIIPLLKKSPLVSACAFLVVLLLAFSYLRMGSMGELQAAIDEKSKELRVLETNIKNAAQLETQITDLRALNTYIREHAVRDGDLVGNQQFFLRLEDELGVKLVDFRSIPTPAPVVATPPARGAAAAGSTPPASPYITLRFMLKVSGTYSQLMNFAKRFESTPTLAAVVSASYSESDTEQKTLDITIDLLGVRS